MKTNRTVFYSRVISLIWLYVLDSWKVHNNALHSPDHSFDFRCQALEPQVLQIFQQIAEDPIFYGHEPHLTAEQILQQPIHTIQRFAQTSNMQMQHHLQAAQQWAQMKIRDIRSYLTSPV